MKTVLNALAMGAVVALAGCGTVPPGAPPSSSTSVMSSTPTPTPSSSAPSSSAPHVEPDATSIARILLDMKTRPSYLSPYGEEIGGPHRGLGPSLRIAGYRADPLFVCVQHVNMSAGTAGAWTAYSRDLAGKVTLSHGPGGRCPTAPGSTVVSE